MNHYLVQFIRDARLNAGLKQQEVGEKLGYKANTISNWESGRTEPDIDTLVSLCQLYNVNFANMLNIIYHLNYSEDSSLSIKEFEHIKKYRILDCRGRKNVDDTLDREFEFCRKEKGISSVSLY